MGFPMKMGAKRYAIQYPWWVSDLPKHQGEAEEQPRSLEEEHGGECAVCNKSNNNNNNDNNNNNFKNSQECPIFNQNKSKLQQQQDPNVPYLQLRQK